MQTPHNDNDDHKVAMSDSDVLPAPYYYFFWIVEPVSSCTTSYCLLLTGVPDVLLDLSLLCRCLRSQEPSTPFSYPRYTLTA
jgi:hypothetical protein